ncbi:hypothetical protein SAMD00023353_6100180 [Rosellinia necatrix]|uniref:Uncharacterized protein n=1 Tax=Rosellinia necatrix TaxID=77044 RepID=A0A1W2TTV6_ROSNE|nr:hypothetical protein SAMD00023353_6100180 [Rosellinia necatrix]
MTTTNQQESPPRLTALGHLSGQSYEATSIRDRPAATHPNHPDDRSAWVRYREPPPSPGMKEHAAQHAVSPRSSWLNQPYTPKGINADQLRAASASPGFPRHPTILTPGGRSRRFSGESFDGRVCSPVSHQSNASSEFSSAPQRWSHFQPLTPTQIPTQPPTPPLSRRYSEQQSPGTAYGAWVADQPRQRQVSLLSRAQARLERGLHDRLVKAGRKPQSGFKVLKVQRAPTGDVKMGERWEEQPNSATLSTTPITPATLPSTPSSATSWCERMERFLKSCGGGEGTQPPTLPSPSKNENEIRDAEFEREEERLMARAELFLNRDKGKSSPSTPPSPQSKSTPGSDINTRLRNFSLPLSSAERAAPYIYDQSSANTALASSPKSSSFSFEEGLVIRPAPGQKINDPHFLNLLSNNAYPQQDWRFYSPDSLLSLHDKRNDKQSVQKWAAPKMKEGEIQPMIFELPGNASLIHELPGSQPLTALPLPGNQPPVALPGIPSPEAPPNEQSPTTLPKEDEEKRVAAPSNRLSVLSMEQIGLASLPSAFEDLHCPFPFDERSAPPSQTGRMKKLKQE